MADPTPMTNGRVLLTLDDNVALLTLNDPAVLNAFGVKLKADCESSRICWPTKRGPVRIPGCVCGLLRKER